MVAIDVESKSSHGEAMMKHKVLLLSKAQRYQRSSLDDKQGSSWVRPSPPKRVILRWEEMGRDDQDTN